MKPLLYVVKIGGNLLDDASATNQFLKQLAQIAGPVLLVHGGGKLATELGKQLGQSPQLIDGRRITDSQTLQTVVMVYAGWINKSLVAALNVKGKMAIGLSGADAKLLPAVKRPVFPRDYGEVGDLLEDKIPAAWLANLLDSGMLPVIAPIAFSEKGNLLNVNADTVATALAKALTAFYTVRLVYGFEQPGVMANVDNPESLISTLSFDHYQALKDDSVIHGGMLPKLDNAFRALQAGVEEVFITHALQLNLLPNAGTLLVK